MTGGPPEEERRVPEDKPLGVEGMLGVGFDGKPDDVHITRGENFYLYGGSVAPTRTCARPSCASTTRWTPAARSSTR